MTVNEDKRIVKGFLFLGALFVLLIGFLTTFEVFFKEKVVNNSYNRRIWEMDTGRIRGSIFDRKGTLLAYSEENSDGRQERTYPFQGLYAHVIGYHTPVYGNSQLEATYQIELSGNKAWNRLVDLPRQWAGETLYGNELHLTLDHDLQKKAQDLLKGRRGAVVALDPKTGALLALVSNPTFDPNGEVLAKEWDDHQKSEDFVLLPRATQGLYAPGSTFKVITAAASLVSQQSSFVWEDEGSVLIDGMEIANYDQKVYGSVDLEKALTLSVNTYFAALSQDLGASILKAEAEGFGFNQTVPFSIPASSSRFPQGTLTKTQLASAAIGQGDLLASPLQMALVAAAIANEGRLMEPYLVEEVRMHSQKVVEGHTPKEWIRPLSAEHANQLKEWMVRVVEQGTGTRAAFSGITVAGKTGTAQNERKGEDHAWFIGFAPAEDPQIAIAVLLEYSGSTGGSAAAPIAGTIMKEYLK